MKFIPAVEPDKHEATYCGIGVVGKFFVVPINHQCILSSYIMNTRKAGDITSCCMLSQFTDVGPYNQIVGFRIFRLSIYLETSYFSSSQFGTLPSLDDAWCQEIGTFVSGAHITF